MLGLLVLGLGLALGLVLEVGLRWVLGLGTPPLYVADATMGYRLAPNQRLRRFGNRIEINAYSLRNGPITPLPAPETLRVLLLGDSIVNGGWWTDQSQTLSVRLGRDLQQDWPAFSQDSAPISQQTQPQFEILNASANSWGPRNELAYVEWFGLFGSQALVLVLNTDDLFGAVPSSLKVGHDRNYPDRRPPSALWELYRRYLRPLPPDPHLRNLPPETGDLVAKNLAAVAEIHTITQNSQIPLLLALTPLKRELACQNGPRPYEQEARDRLQHWATQAAVPYLDLLPAFNQDPNPLHLYRDHIHLSPLGDRHLSHTLAQALIPLLLRHGMA